MTLRNRLSASAALAAVLALPALLLPALLLPASARAQPVNGLYIGGAAGLNFKQDQSFRANFPAITDNTPSIVPLAPLAPGSAAGRLDYDIGFGVLGSVGWGFGNGLRAEIEGSYRNNGIDRAHVSGFGGVPLSGTAHTYAVMTNLLFDMNINQSWIFPYIGAGAGYAWNNLENLHPSGSPFPRVDGTSGNFAYQAMLGAAIPITAVPGLSFTAEYRFMGMLGDTHYQAEGAPIRVALKDQYNHAGMFGLRYAFGAPAPAPAPMPVAAPVAPAARSFMVFFDWDKYNLTERARAVVRDAAEASRTVRHTRLEVNGYADTSGTPGYNRQLSMKRAQAVASELVRNGVAKQEIAIQAFGDTVLLVPTGPGVREPQNRRVEIIIKS